MGSNLAPFTSLPTGRTKVQIASLFGDWDRIRTLIGSHCYKVRPSGPYHTPDVPALYSTATFHGTSSVGGNFPPDIREHLKLC